MIAIYEGITLLSVSYCDKQLKRIIEKNAVSRTRGYDITIGAFDKDPELKALAAKISYYSNIMGKLKNSFANVTDDELIEFATEQISIKMKQAKCTKVAISLSYVSEYTTKIDIYDKGNHIFSTELTFKRKVYEKYWDENENYDGYLDIAKFICHTTETVFLREVFATINTKIHNQLSI